MEDSSILLQLNEVGWQAGNTKILNNICFNLHAGEFKLITGPSGCGKSTLLKIVASLISPSYGEILFEGKEISTLKPEAYRQQVSYCAQTPALFGDTVYDNLIFPWQIRHKHPQEEAFLADLARFELPETILKKASMNCPAVKSNASRSFVICSFCPKFCCSMKSPARWMKPISGM